MESPMLTRIKPKKQEEPSTMQILGQALILGAVGIAGIIIVFSIIANLG
jgi:hypothetical protein